LKKDKGTPGKAITEWIIYLLLFAAAFLILYSSPILKIGDSKYTMLLSEQLLLNQKFYLDSYFWPHVDSSEYPEVLPGDKLPRHLIRSHDHLYYVYPHGTSLLSVPFVAALRLAGMSTIQSDGTYDFEDEKRMQKIIAAFLMALTCVLFYLSIWSTASRSMQSHTWNVLLHSLALYLILRVELGKEKLHPIFLATIFSAGFFVRPTSIVFIIPLAALIFLRYKKQAIWFVTTGFFWLILFFIYSQVHFHHILPIYYRFGTTLHLKYLGSGLLANLISPSRGLFIFVPLILIAGYLLIVFRHSIKQRELVFVSVISIFLHLILVSTWWAWWSGGGGTYGARFSTDIVPLIVLLGILGIRAALDNFRIPQKKNGFGSRLKKVFEISFAGLFVFLSVAFNGAGALSKYGNSWNELPVNIDLDPHRIFSLKHPQFYCALFPAKISGKILTSGEIPLKGIKITFTRGGGNTSTDFFGKYTKTVGYGWSGKAKPLGKANVYFPQFREYMPMESSKKDQNYACTPLTSPETPAQFTARKLSKQRIRLDWKDRSRNEDGFEVERRYGANDTWQKITKTRNDTFSFVDKIKGKPDFIQYRIRAVNSNGHSPYSITKVINLNY
jgi:hypothetical protein